MSSIQYCPLCNGHYNMDNPIDNINVGSIDEIALRLKMEGITMVDVLYYYNNRYNSREPRYQPHNDTCLYTIEWVEQIIPEIINKVDTKYNERRFEQYERWLMKKEDN